MARNDPQINLRIPENLKALVEEAAADNKRSMTAEIIARLEASFTGSGDEALIAALDAARARVAVFSALFDEVNVQDLLDKMSDESDAKLGNALAEWQAAKSAPGSNPLSNGPRALQLEEKKPNVPKPRTRPKRDDDLT